MISAANDWLRTHSKLYLYLKDITTDPSTRYFLADYKEYEDNIDAKLDPFLKIADVQKCRYSTFDSNFTLREGRIRISPHYNKVQMSCSHKGRLRHSYPIMLPSFPEHS